MAPGRGHVLFLFLLTLACTPPPLVHKESIPALFDSHLAPRSPAAGTAYGDARICIDGESYAGSADVVWDTGSFKAHFYGPLGVVIASVEEAGGRGRVLFDEGDYSFGRDQTMDTLPFSWGSDLTFGDLAIMLTGRVPELFGTRVSRPPDSVVEGRKAINAWWKTDTLQMRVKIRRNKPRVEGVEIICTRHREPWFFSLGKFKRGVAHKIELRENDRNYFLIKYTKVNIR